ncbi:MAG: hypothetical protein ACOH1H_03360 [Brevundimonas sp.]
MRIAFVPLPILMMAGPVRSGAPAIGVAVRSSLATAVRRQGASDRLDDTAGGA